GQLRQRRAALARHALDHPRRRQPDGFLGQEHQSRPLLLGRRHGDQESHGDLLGILQTCRQADDRLAAHCLTSPHRVTANEDAAAKMASAWGSCPIFAALQALDDEEAEGQSVFTTARRFCAAVLTWPRAATTADTVLA